MSDEPNATPHTFLTSAGVLPFTKGPIRFAVGSPSGVCSNAWRVWVGRAGDVYVACRDNFKEAKVSLHTSGRWRMGFTTEAIVKNSGLVGADDNRAWEVWDRPPEALPQTIIAFRLIFPSSELAVRPEQRDSSTWKSVCHIEAAPPGKVVVATLFITRGAITLRHESEPSFCLALLDVGNGLFAQVIVHSDPENDLPDLVERAVAEARQLAESKGTTIPLGSYGYFFGHGDDGSRFLFGAKLERHAKV